jgi:hypothetical protein
VLRSLGADYAARGGRVEPGESWDAGWSTLCGGQSPTVFQPTTAGARTAGLLAAIQLGDFGAAERLARPPTPEPDAYAAALQGDWVTAAGSYAALADPSAAVVDRFWGAVLYHAGQVASAAGDRARAARWLVAAQTLVGQAGPPASPALAACLDQWGRPDEARDEWRRVASVLATDDPRWSHIESLFGPRSQPDSVPRTLSAAGTPPQFRLSDGATGLAGLDVDARDLRASPIVHVTLYWPTDQPGQLAQQHLSLRNLVANSALGLDAAAAGVRPFGFPRTLASEPFGVSVEQRDGQSAALCLQRPLSGGVAGIEGVAASLAGHQAPHRIAQGGQVMSPDGSGFALGRWWDGTDEAQPYSYVASGPTAPAEWTSYVGTAVLPAAARSVRVWLYNGVGPSQARTCYRDLFMFELPDSPAGSS